MKTYQVGGAVRDRLLGIPHGDRDWVVVGATPEQLLAQGYTPVGKDFPVFLHPQTREEYALARTERKSAPGYRGFVVHADPTVTLEDDLRRRDLTVNAIAQAEDGTLIDPHDGAADLRAGVLRHVSEAFAEDPVRILRLARFAARWPRFTVADETMALCRAMVQAGEVDALVPERVWQELSRGLMEGQPSRMVAVLRDCGALARLLPEVNRLWGVPQPAQHHPEIDTGVHLMMVLDTSARLAAPLPVRYACLVHDLGKGTTPQGEWPRHIDHETRSADLAEALAERLRVPAECRELGEIVAREHGNIHRSESLDAAATMRLLERCDALRRPERFEQALWACECDARGRAGRESEPYPQRARLSAALRAVLAVDATAAAAQAVAKGAQGPAIGEAVRRARLAAL
jgi:tRNA nucleotidyltransferase (CCA-adding enzyme)